MLWNDKAIVLELKRVYASDLKAEKSKNPDKRQREREDICMNVKLDEACLQIADNEYQDGVFLAYPAASDMMCYAVAFCGKRCMVRKVGGGIEELFYRHLVGTLSSEQFIFLAWSFKCPA
ncbi:MAG: hypothetical protein IJU23_10520 [Proteobacteria bacterium]|nr:hypothetical protein [Pseudomonadota bacterium]